MRIIVTHKNVDLDAFASLVAGTVLYPDAIPVLPRSINPNVKSFISIHKDLFKSISPAEIDIDKVKTLIATDVNSWGRLEGMKNLRKKNNLEILLWDHHPKGDMIPTWKCQEQTGATITLMIRQIKKENKPLTNIQATLFLAGLYEDTGNLMFPSTTVEDVYAAAYLLEQNADLRIINSFMRPVYGPKHKDILFKMLASASRTRVKGYSVSINKIPIKGHVTNLAVVVHMYKEILNVDAAFGVFINKEREQCIIIGRSSIDDLNIGRIMRTIGGGGHQAAGSAMLKSVNPDEIEEKLMGLIKGNQGSSVNVTDLMSFPVFSVSPDTPMEEVAAVLREKGCTGVPVMDGEKIAGMISRRDFKKLKNESQLKRPVKTFMIRECITIDADRSPAEASRLIVKHDIGRLPVIHDGQVIGIITRSDVMLYFYDLLPE